MKKLLLIILFSASLSAFSQAISNMTDVGYSVIDLDSCKANNPARPKPDTLRAIVLVTLSPNGIAHSRMGFVVISEGKRPVYLDCQKKALKLPQVGWGYELINPNEKLKK